MKNFGFLLLIILFTSCGSNQPDDQIQWESHTDNDFVVYYPSDWELDTSGEANTTFHIISPSDSFVDSFHENVNLLVQDLSSSGLNSLEEFMEFSTNQIEGISPNNKILKSKSVESKGRIHHEISYTFDYESNLLQCEQFIWVEENKAYILTFTARESTFKEYESIGRQILSQFEIKV